MGRQRATYPGTYAAWEAASPGGIADRGYRAPLAGCHRAIRNVRRHAERRRPLPIRPPRSAAGFSNGLIDFLMIRRLAYFKPGEAPPPQELCNLTHPEKSLLLSAPLPRRRRLGPVPSAGLLTVRRRLSADPCGGRCGSIAT